MKKFPYLYISKYLLCGYSQTSIQQLSKCYQTPLKKQIIGFLTRSFVFTPRHVRYTHPEAVLAPNVTLLNIDEKFAVFAVVNGKKDVLKNESGPFMYINQFNLCSELIRMPLESFLQLADEVGDPKGKLVILSNTG